MKQLSYTGLVLFIFSLLISCKSGSQKVNFEGGSMDQMKSMELQVPPPPPASQALREMEAGAIAADKPLPVSVSRKIIRDGNMEIRVNDLEKGKSDVDTLVSRFKAYYSNETFNNADYSRGYSLMIRIPSENFEAFMAAIEAGSGEVVFKNISSRDVTEDFIDLETRLANKKNYLSRYSELLKQAKTVKDILEIQEKTRVIEEEVESVQGRLKYLNNQVDYSTLNLQISKKNDFSIYSHDKGSFFDRLKLSLVKGWFGLVSFSLFLLRIWPFWLIAGALYYLIRRIWKRRRK